MSGELQSLVDDLAEPLGRSVVIDDPGVVLVCASRHFGDEDLTADEIEAIERCARDAAAQMYAADSELALADAALHALLGTDQRRCRARRGRRLVRRVARGPSPGATWPRVRRWSRLSDYVMAWVEQRCHSA